MLAGLLLDWLILTVSFFNTISLLWLGLMILLVGNRRTPGVWLTGGGMLLGALFFTSHTAILGRGLGETGLGMNFWWWVSWAPALAAPLAWYGAILWYAGYRFGRPHRHHGWVGVAVGLLGAIIFLLLFANPLPNYQYVAGRGLAATPGIAGIPLLVVLYLGFSLLCYLLPLDLLRPVAEGAPLEARVRQHARPWLVAASLALLLAGLLLSWTALWALTTRPLPSLADAQAELTVKRFDLAVAGCVALAITLLGRAIVAYEVFTGQPLPRTRFFRHWRSTVILAGGFGAVAAWMLAIQLRPIYTLMLATSLMTLFYALYSWRSFVEREEFMARLRPFVASQNLYRRMVAAGEPAGQLEDPARALFDSLCRDLLEVRRAVLAPAGSLATLAGPPLVYPAERGGPAPQAPTGNAPTAQGMVGGDEDLLACLAGLQQAALSADGMPLVAQVEGLPRGLEWAIPLWAGHGAAGSSLCGFLLLGERRGGGPFREEEIEVAQAAGERLVDLLAGAEMARLSLDLLAQRLAQTRVLEGQGRRVLHDEVLPELHTAILYLSSLLNRAGEGAEETQAALEILTGAHRRISDLMRQLPLATPHSLGQGGLPAALRSLVENRFAGDFGRVEWAIDPEAEDLARQIPLFMAEVLFFAARELMRNAADHAPGGEDRRALVLWVELSRLEQNLRLVISDNGIGIHLLGSHAKGSGLRIHSAMLASIGGQLEISPRPGGGTRGVIDLPVRTGSNSRKVT